MTRLAASTLAAVAALAACDKKPSAPKPPPHAVAGLAAVPVDASVVISVDVARVQGSPLVTRGLELLVGRSPGLRERWAALAQRCQLSLGSDVRRVVVALGPRTPAQPVLMVVHGAVEESRFAGCVAGAVGQGSGVAESEIVDGRARYVVRDGGRTVWMSYGQPDTIVLSTSDTWLHAAVTDGPKVATDPTWQAAVVLADLGAPIWVAGAVPERVAGQLVRVSQGAVTAGPKTYVGSIDLSTGARVEVGAVMASAADATALLELARGQLGLMEMVAQRWGLGPLVAKVQPAAEGVVFELTAGLTLDELGQVLDVLDGTAPAAGGGPPALGIDTVPPPPQDARP